MMQSLEFSSRSDPETASFFLDISPDALEIPEHIRAHAAAHNYTEKGEPHVTIVGRKIGAKLFEIGAGDMALERAHETNWHVIDLPIYHVIRKLGEKSSLIQMARVPELYAFYDTLAYDTGLSLNVPPPPHITLFTRGDPEGIGLYSWQDLDTYKHETLL